MDSNITRPIDDYCNPVDILKLAQMLKPEEESSEDEGDALPAAGLQKLGPGDICPKKPKPIRRIADKNVVKGEGKSCDEIREYEDLLLNNEEDENILGDHSTPKFDIIYKQAISSEDIFLQMGMKTPATASCEDMIITIDLPGETMETVDLVVTKEECSIDGKKFKLRLPLPQKCDPDLSKAQWISDLEQLKLTLRLVREYDFVNF